MGSVPQKNSFVTIAEQVSLLNANSVEIISKMSSIVTSSDSTVNINQTDNDGVVHTYSMPTVGKLQAQIDELNNNVNRLAGLNDNNVHIVNGNSTKRIYLSDLNREPNRIDKLDVLTTFSQTNNWFFESLMSPTLSVKLDLTNKVGSDVDGVISRRYIVKFERDIAGVYTSNGERSRVDFINKFIGKNDINLSDFTTWYTNKTNIGVVNNLIPLYDEQYFDFEYQEVSDQGVFSVMKQELDSVNNKMWFHVYPYTYTTSDGKEKVLNVGDELILNKEMSVTRWGIIETSTASSNFRVRLERLEGIDPIPTGNNVLKYYGNLIIKKEAKVTFGFDEYLVIFTKPLNGRNKIKGSLWSKGTGLYTNDLILDVDPNMNMSRYYLEQVSDYGNLIRDMIKKSIPSVYGIKPNAPVLVDGNFKVVQINTHLTDNTDSKLLNQLNQDKNTVKSNLEQVGNSIIKKNQDLATKVYNSQTEKDVDTQLLSKLVSEQATYTTQLNSITTQLTSKISTTTNVPAKFNVRGFWDLPSGQTQSGYRTQEVIQFHVEYRYSSKNGTENQTIGYNMVNGTGTTTAYFSNWIPLETDLRKRSYDETTQTWSWIIEDVSNADTPNINQLDIPITVGERVEVRVQSISEVGYPDSKLYSDFSNILTIDFPDNLNNISDSNQFILKEAQLDNIKSDFDLSLGSKGITRHVQDAFYINNTYVSHGDDTIQTNYKDTQGNSYSLRNYLDYLTNRITTLENIIYSAKGVLKVTLVNGTQETEIKNNSDNTFNVILQNYGTLSGTDSNVFKNVVSVIKDYNLKIENLSTSSDLSFLLNDSYVSGTTVRTSDLNLASLVDNTDNVLKQLDAQYIYFCDNISNQTNLYSNNWMNDSEINAIYSQSLESNKYNLGLTSEYGTTEPNIKLMSNVVWTDGIYTANKMGTTIAPMINSVDDLKPKTALNLSKNEQINIPLNIYWLFKTGENHPTINLLTSPKEEHFKSVRVRLHPSSLSVPFEFVINFSIQNKK